MLPSTLHLEGKIELGANREGEWLQMWVEDNGPGIPLADQERIFDKFTRLKEAGSPNGLGVGLAFCRLAVAGTRRQNLGRKAVSVKAPNSFSLYLLQKSNKSSQEKICRRLPRMFILKMSIRG